MESIHTLWNFRDLLLIAFVLITAFMGAGQGLVRTVFGLLGKLISLAGATFAAKLLAHPVASIIVTPIVGKTFREQASRLPQVIASSQGAQTLEDAITAAAVSMAEGVAFLLLFVLFTIGFSFLLSLIAQSLHFVAKLAPLNLFSRLGGLICGVVGGVVLLMIASLVLQRTSPELFTNLGWLSSTNTENTVLMKKLLEMTGAYL